MVRALLDPPVACPGSGEGVRTPAVRLVRGAIEAGVLVLVCLSPWAFGAVEPLAEFAVYAGVAVLLGLWGVRMLLEGRLAWAHSPAGLCLAALILFTLWQLVPLPRQLLGWVSPATARTYAQLLPEHEEVLPLGEARDAPPASAGATISLYPGRTRQELIRLLAVFALFAVVRCNTASPAVLRRLSIAATANGALLSLFALVQFFSSPPDTLYWTYQSPGTVFGPFICRNHFAFYINICLGLGLGLLLSFRSAAAGGAPGERDWLRSAGELLHEPQAWWTSGALALMLCGVICCLSRGGMLTLAGCSVLFVVLALWRSGPSARLKTVLLPLALAVPLLAWFGVEGAESRFATIWEGKAQESRLPLWSRVLPSARDFPLWGTGSGTFEHVEPLHRGDALDDNIYTNAENDYLEALVEGGLVRLVLSLLLVGLVFWSGYRAFLRLEGRRGGGLVLGALFGLGTVAVHSFGDFGIHIPAVAVLATVLCANLCALGDPEPRAAPAGRPGTSTLGLRRLVPLAGAVTVFAFGLLLVHEGRKLDAVQRLHLEAMRPERTAGDAEDAVRSLEAAAALSPESARLQVELAELHLECFRERTIELKECAESADAAQPVVDLGGRLLADSSAAPGLALVASWAAGGEAREQFGRREEAALVRAHLVPALRHFLRARALCPLLPEPHRSLADYRDRLDRADERVVYLGRAARVAPHHPGVWYLYGGEFLTREPDRAWESWRRSLELSDLYLEPIVRRSAEALGADGVREHVLPDKPAVLLAAALQLYPQQAEGRRPFLEKALDLLRRQPDALKPDDLRLKAQLQASLGRTAEAIDTYRVALARQPNRQEWRYELAELLHEEGRAREAYRELLTVLRQQPDHEQARELLPAVKRQLTRPGGAPAGSGEQEN